MSIRVKPLHYIKRDRRERQLMGYGVFLMLTAFFWSSPREIFEGLWVILTSPCNLLTDYMALANVGAAFMNSGLVTVYTVWILRLEDIKISGPVLASVFTVSGFAFFGKNLFNSIPITIGIYAYAKVYDIPFDRVALSSVYSSSLAPLVSFIAFDLGLPAPLGIFFGYLAGFVVGFVFNPVADMSLGIHKGYNLYNAGLASGFIGMSAVAVMRMFDIRVETVLLINEENTAMLTVFLVVLAVAIFIVGVVTDGYYPGRYRLLLRHTGHLGGTWIAVYGYGTVLMNMSAMILFSTLFVRVIGGSLSGPAIGAILSVAGFSAAGVHPRNAYPIFIGVFLAGILNIYSPHAAPALLAVIFGTGLVPIAGTFGPFWGIFAGFFHMAMVMNIGYLHGGLNLYNNGFSAGLVAAILYPIIDMLRILPRRILGIGAKEKR